MSHDIDEILEALDEATILEKKIQELRIKKLDLEERKVNLELNRVQENDRNLALMKEANFGQMSPEQIRRIIDDNNEYMEAAKNKMMFVDHVFDKVAPFFRKNIILVGGSTGDGKSTTVSNIVRSTISQRNKETGKAKKVLVITNEQLSEDFYNSITCQIKGWEYNNHNEFTEEQKETFQKFIQFLAESGTVTVVDDNYNGSSGNTTTIEGIRNIFDDLIAKKQFYDVVLIDYYQNITISTLNPKLNEYEVQRAFCNALDQYKNTYPAPIVLMAQVKPLDKEETPFKFRMEGTKKIMNVATCVFEIIADRENFRTEWIAHKSRFQKGIVGHSYYVGYENGQFVPYGDEFKKKVAVIQERRQQELMNKIAGENLNKKVKEEEKK